MMIPKRPPVRDRAFLDSLRLERCIFTGRVGTDQDQVVPAHLGTLGKGLKSGDDEALPVLGSIHQQIMHQAGEISALRALLPDDVLLAALRAYARERYRATKETGDPAVRR